MSENNQRGRKKIFIWKNLTNSLIGLKVSILRSSSKQWEGVKGVIIDETFNLLIIETNQKTISIPKTNQIFAIETKDGSVIQIEGKNLEGYPEHRIRKKLRNW
ncbi:ribonuclease P protein subunit [Candidatus Heimdallarchaeota archaeon]|nr:MAG: ribonuclease P protein subunit [Candidatus Heimdallarchaeota archaeon]